MDNKNEYGSDIKTDREKRLEIKNLIWLRHSKYSEDELEQALEERLENKNNRLRQTTEPLPKIRQTEKYGIMSRKTLHKLLFPKSSFFDICEFGVVLLFLVVMWFLALFFLFHAESFKDTLLSLIMVSIPAFFTYTLVSSRISGKKTKISIIDDKLKIKSYRIIDMARKNIGTDSTDIICYLFVKPLCGGKTIRFGCEYADYKRFREGDYIYGVYIRNSDHPLYIFREEEWDYDDEFTKLMKKERTRVAKYMEKDENGKQN